MNRTLEDEPPQDPDDATKSQSEVGSDPFRTDGKIEEIAAPPKDQAPLKSQAPLRTDSTPVQISIDDPRVFLAAERTLLAWIRTSIATMGLGFLVAKFGLFVREMLIVRGGQEAEAHRLSLWIGASMVVLGIVMVVTASVDHYLLLKRLNLTQFVGTLRSGKSTAIALMLAVMGIVMVLYLFAV